MKLAWNLIGVDPKKIYWAGGKCQPPRFKIRKQMRKLGWLRLFAKWGACGDSKILRHIFSIKPKIFLIQQTPDIHR